MVDAGPAGVGTPGWVGYEVNGWRIRMHTQELAENIPDTAHFLYVHSLPVQPVAEIEVDGHIYRQRTVTRSGDESSPSPRRRSASASSGCTSLAVGRRCRPGRLPPEYTFLTATRRSTRSRWTCASSSW